MRIRHPGWWIGAGISLVALTIVIFVIRPFDESATHSKNHPPYPAEYAVQMFESQGRDHIAPGQVFNGYNSNPPASGPHGPAARWGVYDVPVPKESAVHNMEHGGVVIWYDCEGGPAPLDAASCGQLRGDLAGIVQPRVSDGMFILMTPYGGMKTRIALTAWQYLDAFNAFDAARVEAFIASFECLFNAENTC